MTGQTPRLTRATPPPKAGIVHLGLGAFFRAFGAPIIEDAIDATGGDWGIIGVSLKSPRMRDSLAGQANAYTMVELSPEPRAPRIVNVLSDVVFAPEAPEALLEQMADSAIKIVSLTVTEKGYCHIPSTGMLDAAHPDIRKDIADPHPLSAIGYIARALQRRRAAGVRPFTVLSCDNLPDNGRVARNVVVGLAEHIDTDLADWIATEGCFPSTMVDRIVPATTPADIEQLQSSAGYHDAAPVFHEPFCQWAIEDSFVDGQRPDFEQSTGVQMVSDVAPFEAMKIRMLNGTHSSLAYLGYFAGYETIAETVQDPVFRAFVQKLWRDEIIPTVKPPQGVDLQAYAQDLLNRYANPSIRHKTWQIAMDGSQKLPQRILGTIADNRNAGRRCDGLILAVAAWMRYVGGVDEKGNPIEVKDPLAGTLRGLSDAGTNPREKVDNLLSVKEVFATGIAQSVRGDLVKAFEALSEAGAKESLTMHWAQT
jgi:fructuronate reductase